MFWSRMWSRLLGRAPKAPARRTNLKLSIESLEDRCLPSGLTYSQWQQQTFRVDDVQVANSRSFLSTQAAVPTNASFGSMIGLPSAFTDTSYRGEGYSVAVIDTGIDYSHPSLGGGFGAGRRVVAGWDFVNNDDNPMDDNGHGTHVAGIIGSADATYSGVAPNVNLIALKVLDASGSGSFGNVEKALQWVAANRAKYNIVAINLSLGTGNYTSNPYTFLDDEFSSLKNNGVFLSVAAGNSFYSYSSAPGLDYPAVSPYVVSVGAVYVGNFGSVAWASGARDVTTAVDRVASFSQRSSALTIMAPGAMITSTYLNSKFQAMAGTSMAAPVVAGASVLVHQALDASRLNANQDAIVSILKKTGVNVVDGDDENDNVANTGLSFKRLDVGAALASLGKPGNTAPVLQAIPNQSISPSGSVLVTLSASDANGDAITYSAIVLSASSNQAFQLKQQLGLAYAGSYFSNNQGQNEKWMNSTSTTDWYCILPNGELRRWAGSMTVTMQAANLIATLDARFYADPSLLWNAQTAGAPTLTIAGNLLTIQAPSGVSGNYQIQVTASDGSASSSQTFTLVVQQNNTAPQIGALANLSMLTNRRQTIILTATDAQNDPIAYTAQFVAKFDTAPATLALSGNQLTIHTSPDSVGEFDVQVTASDGFLASTTVLHVSVAASAVAQRFSADFNGDGIKDTTFFNQDGSWWVSLNKADGSFVNQNWANWTASSNWNLIQVGDFDGDGKSDAVGFYNDGSWWVGRSTGAAFATQFWAKWHAPSAWRFVQVGDFDGDRKTDLFGFYNDGSQWVGKSSGAACTTIYWATWDAGKYWSYLQVGDFNGDGKSDLVGVNLNGVVYVGLSNGYRFAGAVWARWQASSNWASFATADVNGDGKLDFIGQDTAGMWYVAYSTGSNFNTQLWTSTTPPTAK